jgi:predicted ATPase
MLILLYTLLYGVAGDKRILFIDEPDNFLSPREVQPWLTSLTDLCGRRLEQAVVASHHPETINYLADRQGIYLTRDGQGPTRVVANPRWTDGLTPAETVARGWVS